MLRNQESLPHLPVPELNNLFQFLDWIRPIVNAEEYMASQKALDEFLMPAGDGEKLQKKLREIAQENSKNWLEPLWNDMYLEYREPLVCNMNYYAVLENTKLKAYASISALSAKLIFEFMSTYFSICSRQLSPEFSKAQPLCMEQYDRLFKAVRLPRLKKDEYRSYSLAKPNHIVVYYKNNLFKLETTNSAGGIHSLDWLASKIQSILDANIEDRGHNIGVLTTAKRDEAARLYEALKIDKLNKSSLEIINTAIFVLCIDPSTASLADFQKRLLLSDGKNRYFDKSCQVIITENRHIGINNEHTGADGTPWFSVINQAFNKIVEASDTSVDLSDTTLPEELQWNLTADIKAKLVEQLKKHQAFADDIYVENLIFKKFGKDLIKSLNLSPDAFFHIALQLAQYKTFGKFRSTYEAVSMRHFNKGRTECTRAVNEAVAMLAKEIYSNDASQAHLKELLKKAQCAHGDRIRKCQKGRGIERHLFALFKMYEKYGSELDIQNEPALYVSVGYKLLKHDYMSTSGISLESICLFGFGPVVEDGYGIGYVINDQTINIALSTKILNKPKGRELLNNLSEAMQLLISLG